MTMIVVTHEIGFTGSVADEVVFMSEGKPREPSSPASSEVTKRRPSND
jgi:ABC-type polar amino acid transport system ATPase subunit